LGGEPELLHDAVVVIHHLLAGVLRRIDGGDSLRQRGLGGRRRAFLLLSPLALVELRGGVRIGELRRDLGDGAGGPGRLAAESVAQSVRSAIPLAAWPSVVVTPFL